MTRRVEWLVLLVAVVIAWPVWNYRGDRRRRGDTIDAAITLITSDHDQLSCASPKTFGSYRCEFKSPGHGWPRAPLPEEQLAPYHTTESELFLIPNLFQQPALLARYEQEPPARIPIPRLRRFTARCRLRLVKEARGVRTRWLRSDQWGDALDTWVAEAVTCTVSDD